MMAKKRFFLRNRIFSVENIIFALKFKRDEARKNHSIVPVGIAVAVWLLCLFEVLKGDASGRASDGADGKTVGTAIRPGKVSPLQAPVQENQADDEAGQASCRAYASASQVESLLLTTLKFGKSVFGVAPNPSTKAEIGL